MVPVGSRARSGLFSRRATSLSNAPVDILKLSLNVTSSRPSGPPRRYPEMVEPLHLPQHRGTTRRTFFSSAAFMPASMMMTLAMVFDLIAMRFFTTLRRACSTCCRRRLWCTAATRRRTLAQLRTAATISGAGEQLGGLGEQLEPGVSARNKAYFVTRGENKPYLVALMYAP